VGCVRPNILEVDLVALEHNVASLRELVSAKTRIFAAVKANAYGFGLEQVARTIVDAGVDALAMADPADALRVRGEGLVVPILLYPGALFDDRLIDQATQHELTLTITDLESAQLVSRLAAHPVDVFVKVDIGMERLGVAPDGAGELVERVLRLPNLMVTGLYAHMHLGQSADPRAYFRWQIGRFEEVLDDLRRRSIEIPLAMAASSPALTLLGEPLFDAVDPGHLIYGILPPVPVQLLELRPAFRSLRSRLIQCKAVERAEFVEDAPFELRPGMRIGILPIGRADGLQFVTTGEVLLRGRRCSFVGKLSLEHARIDITDVPEACVGDEVVIIGEQGKDAITLANVCDRTGLDTAGVMISIRSSIPRSYVRTRRSDPPPALQVPALGRRMSQTE
jgi:alanine racemase